MSGWLLEISKEEISKAGQQPSLPRSSHVPSVLRAVPQGGIAGTGGRGAATYLRLTSPLLEQRAAVRAATPALLMELLWRLTQRGGR